MNLRDEYSSYMWEINLPGSGKASSCIRAMELLEGWLSKPECEFRDCADLWNITSTERILLLHRYVLDQQKLEDKGLFKGEKPLSYWRDGWCSAALKNYKDFLILKCHESKLWDLVNQLDVDPAELSKHLNDQDIESLEVLVDQEIDFSSEEGKEVLRETKQRVNQGRFRKLLLREYETKCCVTGLNVPQVLRASHIVAWADDEENRMNPTNGLCLSATYDAAFDRHLISFDEDCRMIFSSDLKEYTSNEDFKTQFLAFNIHNVHRTCHTWVKGVNNSNHLKRFFLIA